MVIQVTVKFIKQRLIVEGLNTKRIVYCDVDYAVCRTDSK